MPGRKPRKKTGEFYKLSALRSIRFGLSRYFSQELEIDIIKDPLFQKANDMFHAISVDLKRKGFAKVYHTESIEPDHLKTLYTSMALSPDTPVGLLQKSWFDIMFFLCRRSRENLRDMKKDTFGFGKDSKGREFVYQLKDEMDKNYRVDTDPSNIATEGRMYEIPGHKLCPVASFRKYLQKLNENRDDLWQRPFDSYTDTGPSWYMDQSIGKNTLGNMLKVICKQTGISHVYTNHSLRATSITVLDFNKFEARYIMAVSDHRSETSLKNYRKKSSKTRIHEMSTALTSALIDENDQNNTVPDSKYIAVQSENIEVEGEIYMNNAQLEELMQVDNEPLDENNVSPKSEDN